MEIKPFIAYIFFHNYTYILLGYEIELHKKMYLCTNQNPKRDENNL